MLILATTKDKNGNRVPLDAIIAWCIDNFRKTPHTAKATLLKATCKPSPIYIRDEAGVTKAAKTAFGETIFERPELRENTQEDYDQFREAADQLRKQIPILYLIEHFGAAEEKIIDKAVQHFGEENIRPLVKAGFWKTFDNGSELEAYMGKNTSPLNGSTGIESQLTVRQVQKVIFKQLLKSLTIKLKYRLGLGHIKEDTVMTPKYCVTSYIRILESYKVPDTDPPEHTRKTVFVTVITYSKETDNKEFFKWARDTMTCANDPGLRKLDKEWFKDANNTFKANCSPIQSLDTSLRNRPVNDLASFQAFLEDLIGWMYENDPEAGHLNQPATDTNGVSHVKKRQQKDATNTDEPTTKRSKDDPKPEGKEKSTDTGDVKSEVRAVIEEAYPSFVQKTMFSKNFLADATVKESTPRCIVCLPYGHHKNMALYNHTVENCELAHALGIKTTKNAIAMFKSGDLIVNLKRSLGLRVATSRSKYEEKRRDNRRDDRRDDRRDNWRDDRRDDRRNDRRDDRDDRRDRDRDDRRERDRDDRRDSR